MVPVPESWIYSEKSGFLPRATIDVPTLIDVEDDAGLNAHTIN